MTIDKIKLQKLLWAEAASFRTDCADWQSNTEALQEFLGSKTVEEVALELLAENKRLRDFLSDISNTSGDKGAVTGARQLLKEFGQ
ncbi:hypothetical protein C4C32_18050 [Pseudomonas corrugata]|uniref:Uncharacterized protein n=1 Tax=Pseudomonas corrugata TaxID=47879 RepID=A0A8B6UKR3_9PSED|nr:hypothetical protein [Pseudomonas corrugata]QTH12490.1 hypothetical protein C4C32_18050 [Pseudomonas corrugata]